MFLQDAKRQRRLHRIANQIRHEQRLRIPKMRLQSVEPKRLTWWQALIAYIKSFFDAKRPANTT